EMAAYHHEWWNGKGYPYGISGEEIPLCARIMAVADVFDALTSKRCYKSAMPLEKAYAIIREESGTHFDPVIVEAFFAADIRTEEKRED
ncbi:MAG: HD domain-containing protein, partial [Ruminococcus flavefaciens]|nr:HD domain-containing protein [Ruminococcus flavefaciens]